MTIATKKDFIDQFNEINALINSNHEFMSNEPNPTKKRIAMRQIDSEVGFEIEQIRLKLEKDEKVSQEEITQIRTALANYYSSRHAKNVFARFILNFLPALVTGPIFHLVYWIIDKFVVLAQAAKKSSPKKMSIDNPLYEDTSLEDDESENTTAKFRWDWTKAIPAVGHSFSTLKAVKNFLDETEDFDISELPLDDNHESEKSDHEKSEKEKSGDANDKTDTEAQAIATKEAKKAALADREVRRAAAKAQKLRLTEEQSQNPSAGKSELDFVKGVTNRLKSVLAKQEAKKAKAEAEKLRVAEEAKRAEEENASKVKFTFEPTIVKSADLEEVVLAPLAPISKTQNAGQIVQYNAAQVQPSFTQKASDIAKKFAAPFVEAFNYFTDPSKLAFKLTTTFNQLLKRPVATAPLAIKEASNSEPLAIIEVVEHVYPAIIDGKVPVILKLVSSFDGQRRSVAAFIFNVQGKPMGTFENVQQVLSSFPSLQVELKERFYTVASVEAQRFEAEKAEFARLNGLSMVQYVESDSTVVEAPATEPRVVVLEDEFTTPVKEESAWEKLKKKAKDLVDSAKKKLGIKPRALFLPTKPNADAMLLSPSNLTGLPLPRLAMRDDLDDINYVNEARENPVVVIDMDAFEDESQKGMGTSAILHTLSPAGLVVRDEQGSILRAPNDTVVALNLETESATNPFVTGDVDHDATWFGSIFQSAAPVRDPFEGFTVPTAVASSNPFIGLDVPVVVAGSNPFDVLDVSVATESASELVDQGYVAIDLGDDGNDSSPEIF